MQVGDTERKHQAGDEICILTVRVLEVAFDNWQQDDIQRYADDYQR